MKFNYFLGKITVMLLVFFASVTTSPSIAQSLSENDVKVLHSDGQSVVLELKVSDYHIETIKHEGQTYQRFLISNMAQSARPGEPQVPTCGTMVGIPSVEGVSVQIIDASYDTLHDYRLYPAPVLQVKGSNYGDIPAGGIEQVFAPNQEIYTTNAFYPDTAVKVGTAGYMRDQAVAQVQFYPVHYNPVTGEVRLYRRILAMVTWHAAHRTADEAGRMRGISPAYENLLKDKLLNYDALRRPPIEKETPIPYESEAESAASASESSSSTIKLKVVVTENGIYKLTYNNLTNAGLNLKNVNPHKISMSNAGSEVPIYVSGEKDGKFNTNDYILFYGTAITDIYTTKNVYWLTIGETNGKRMSERDGSLSGTHTVPTQFPATLLMEEDTYYWQFMPDGYGQDHWFWGDKFNGKESRDYAATLKNISTTADMVTVRIQLKGFTSLGHHTKIYLNGMQIYDQGWNGQIIFNHEVSVPHSYLKEGQNKIRIESVGDTGSSVDLILLNWIKIDYFDTYVAEISKLFFGSPAAGAFQFEVSDFRNSDITVFDITDPANVARISNTTVSPSGSVFTLRFTDTAGTSTRYLAQTYAQCKLPDSIVKDQPSTWKSKENRADYIIITHEIFTDSAKTLAQYRKNSGLKVATVNVEDIYDEFNYGVFNPKAIRDFLAYAYKDWKKPAPTYVLLMGDACYDYKDNLHTGTINYVPSQLVEPGRDLIPDNVFGETASDNWFVLVSGDDALPDMFIGRLSAGSNGEMSDIVDKIIFYEKNPPAKSWNKKVLLAADDDGADFKNTSDELADIITDDYDFTKVYIGDYKSAAPTPTDDLKKYINSGVLLTNFTGHGNATIFALWGEKEDGVGNGKVVLSLGDITSLENDHKFTMVTIADCLNGFFTGLKPEVCIAEQFQRVKDKGAVAIWASTGLGYTSGHRLLLGNFYKNIFQDGQYGLGAAATKAKIDTYSQDSYWRHMVETFVLFGDPATPLGATPYAGTRLKMLNPDGKEVMPSGSTYTVQWRASTDMIKFKLRYSFDNGHSWKKIPGYIEDTSYEWSVPKGKKRKKKCLMEVTEFDVSGKKRGKDRSNSTFTIEVGSP